MPVPSGADLNVSREGVARFFRRRDEDELRTDLVTLMERRKDLPAVRCHELFWASIGLLQERHGVAPLVPTAAAIGAWVDAMVPPAAEIAGSGVAPAAWEVPPALDPITLLSGPQADLTARSLLALTGQRPDLSDLQRHELYLAARLRLVIRTVDFVIPPTRQRIFTWIDLVAPVRMPPADAPARGHPDPQRGTPRVPDGPAGDPSLGDNPATVVAPARTEGRGPDVLPGGLTWDAIDGAYRHLAAATPGVRHRRRRPDAPSRPEVAAALNVSLATLKRACAAAGEGSQWPPIRLRPRGAA